MDPEPSCCAASFTSTWTRSTRRSNSAIGRSCGDGRWRSAGQPAAARRRRGRELRSADVRRAVGDSRWRAPCGSARISTSSRPDFQKYRAVSQRDLRHLPVGHAARRTVVARRGVPRRDRKRVERTARGERRPPAQGDDQGDDRPHGVRGRRAEQVPGEDRVGVAQARRTDGHCAGARRIVPPATAGRCALGRGTGHRRTASRTRHRTAGRHSHGRSRRCFGRRSAAMRTGCRNWPPAKTTGRSNPTVPRSHRRASAPTPNDLTDIDRIREEVAELARENAEWLQRRAACWPAR